ncbi:hypothetical protein CSV86_029445, partial [Pseudomonas putida CSV86]
MRCRVNLGNAVTLNGALSVGAHGNLGLSGPINGAGSLVKTGNTTLTLSGTNGYLGGTTLNAGTLNIASAGAIGSGDL